MPGTIGDLCEDCGDAMAPHVLIPTRGETLLGGIVLCPVPGCDCFATWEVPPYSSKADVVVPPEESIEAMRTALHGLAK